MSEKQRSPFSFGMGAGCGCLALPFVVVFVVFGVFMGICGLGAWFDDSGTIVEPTHAETPAYRPPARRPDVQPEPQATDRLVKGMSPARVSAILGVEGVRKSQATTTDGLESVWAWRTSAGVVRAVFLDDKLVEWDTIPNPRPPITGGS